LRKTLARRLGATGSSSGRTIGQTAEERLIGRLDRVDGGAQLGEIVLARPHHDGDQVGDQEHLL
jgi:hypothetical protein